MQSILLLKEAGQVISHDSDLQKLRDRGFRVHDLGMRSVVKFQRLGTMQGATSRVSPSSHLSHDPDRP